MLESGKQMTKNLKAVNYDINQLQNIQEIFASKMQILLLINLSDGAKSLKELEFITKSRPQNLLPKIGELVEKGILKKFERGIYKATPVGEIITYKILDLIETCEILRDEFWLSHNLNVIPKPLLSNLGALNNSKFHQSEVTLDAAQRTTIQFLENSKKNIWSISPVVSLDWAKTIIHQANHGIKVSIITTDKVLGIADTEEFKQFSPLNNYNIELWINNDLELAFMSDEERIALALPDRKRNVLDLQNFLICEDPEAVAWGMSLFENLRNKSHKINEILLA